MLSLDAIAEIAEDVARTQELRTEVVGVTPGGHDGSYAEVILTVLDCSADPCRLLVGVERHASTHEVRRKIAAALHQHAHFEPRGTSGS
jgi:hypothetical protein